MYDFLKKPQEEARIFNRRVIILGTLITFFIFLLLFRLLYLQLASHSRYTTLAEKNHLKILPIAPTRGLIYDRESILLASNKSVYELVLIPENVPNIKEGIEQVYQLFHWEQADQETFFNTLKKRRRFQPVLVKSQLTEEEVAKFSVVQHQFPGIFLQANLIRNYPYGHTAAHVLGYVGRISQSDLKVIDQKQYSATDYIGKAGVELKYENVLHGQVGFQQVETDVTGRTIRTLEQVNAYPGSDLTLTIDLKLQKIAEEAMEDTVGALVALKPDSGEILALVSKPSYNPNDFVVGLSMEHLNADGKPLYNRVVRGQYAPGSTIKVFHGLQGLEKGYIEETDYQYDPGWFQIEGSSRRFRGWNRAGHGWVNLHKAIVESAATYFYELAYTIGVKDLMDGLSQFGLGQLLDIDLPSESMGLLPSPEWKKATKNEAWYRGDTTVLGIGQGYLLVTPLQLAVATTYIANRGHAWQPHVVKLITTPDNKLLNKQPKALPEVKLKPQHWQTMIKAMEGVIKEDRGTGRRQFGNDAPYTVAGKTGTVQVYTLPQSERGKKQHELPAYLRDHSLFIGFAPVEKPEIVIAVIVEHDTYATTIARKVMDGYLLED